MSKVRRVVANLNMPLPSRWCYPKKDTGKKLPKKLVWGGITEKTTTFSPLPKRNFAELEQIS
jgi:hypothetical protein